jgi:signal transduction histidine kinase/ligand-binding sensor domain-containing protein/DNA-binding response OmpR family regulator
MKTIIRIGLLTGWFLTWATAFLWAQPLSFTRILPTQAASWSGWINGITQDRQGYIWFTTSYGLYRYDGYQVKAYLHDLANPRSLSPGEVETVYADRAGYIWVGTQSAGLDRLDPDTDIFTHFRHRAQDDKSLSDNFVTAILEDNQGTLWVGTQAGLNRLDQPSGTFAHYWHQPGNPTSLTNDQVQVLYEDRQGTLWIGTGSSFMDGNPEGAGGLNRLNRKTGRFTRYVHNPRDPHSLAHNQVQAILEDSHGTFWVGTVGDGLHTMDRRRGIFQHYPYDQAHPEKLSPPQLQKGDQATSVFGLRGNGVSFIQEAQGAIWIGSYYGGINRYQLTTRQLTHFEPDPAKNNGLLDPSLWSAFTTRDGVLFLGSITSNLYRLSPNPVQLTHHPMPFPVSSVYLDSVNRLWFGTGFRGLLIQERQAGQPLIHQPIRSGRDQKKDWVNTLFVDHRETMWVGTRNGLYCHSQITSRFIPYHPDPQRPASLSSDTVRMIYEDRQKNLWIGTAKGLDRMDQKTGTFIHYVHQPGNANSLSEGPVVDLQEDRSRNLWVITQWSMGAGKLNRLNPETGKAFRYPTLTDLVAIAEDGKGLWMATRNNLYRLAANTGVVTKFIDPLTGLGITGIQNMLQDKRGQLWLNTLGALIQINADRNRVRRFPTPTNNQLTPVYQGKRNFYQGRNGEVFFGSRTGYFSFFPEQLHQPDTLTPQIVLHDFRVGGRSVTPSATGPLKEPLFQAQAIELTHRQNAFSIGFAGIHYGQPELNQHLFQLAGYDDEWRQSGTEKTAYYDNIPPGRYTFRVKAANSDGVWAERSLAIVIHPPWWHTGWAYILYGLVFGGLLAGFVRYRLGRERERQERKQKQWEADQLKAMDELKNRFFANITHEFRTPLSLILPATDQLIKEVNEPRHQRSLSVIRRQAGQLLHLITQLLDLAKLEAGGMSLSETLGDITTFTGQLIDSFRPAAEEKDITLRFVTEIEADVWRFDADKWNKIIYNLLSNALKFTPVGGKVTLNLALGDTAQPSVQSILLTVSNTGPGIPADQLPHIFDRFYQVDSSQTRAYAGTGIGLSLVKELVDLLGGQLRVDSRPETGTTFTVALPLTRAKVTAEVPNAPTGDSVVYRETAPVNASFAKPASPDLSQELPLLLIVEDQADLREFIRDELSKTYRVLTAANGQEGWELIKQHLPDLVISDVMMPGMDGFALTQLIKTDPETNHIAVVLLTARVTHESRVTGLSQGADDFLTKPFHFDELNLRVRNLLDHQRKLHQRYRQLFSAGGETPSVETIQDKFWQDLCQAIEAQLDNPRFDVEQLAKAVALSRRTLYRKLATLSGLTPIEVIRNYRLKRATQFLNAGHSVSQTAYQVGFESPSYFGQCFKETYQITPSEYLQQQLARSR